ncbi:hypothetical protein Hdeb2414_s0020g00556151 [Helianthus debilis subsp. tardiflorus]
MHTTDRVLHACVNSRLCCSPPAPVAWVIVLSRKRCCCSYLGYLWRWVYKCFGFPISSNHYFVENSSLLLHRLYSFLEIFLQFLPLMSTGNHHEYSTEDMSAELPPLNWFKATFDGLIRNLQFPENWRARYLKRVRWRRMLQLPITKFFLEILEYYKFHISQLHPIGMVRVRHSEFVCRTMNIEPTVPRFRVFHQMHCSQGFYSFVQRASAMKILLNPPKSFHDWKQKFFFIKVGGHSDKDVF